MPIYEYKCEDCGEEFSLLQSMGSSEADTECSKCGSRKVRKMISSFSSLAAPLAGSSGGAPFSGG